MKKTIIVLLLILACATVSSATEPCPSGEVFKTDKCITNEECCSNSGYLSTDR